MNAEIQSILCTDKYNISITDASFHRHENVLELSLSSEKLLTVSEVEAVKAKLSAVIPKKTTLKLNMTFTCNKDSVKENFAEFSNNVKRNLALAFPECAPIIALSVWNISDSGESISITVPEKYLFAMKKTIPYARIRYLEGFSVEVEGIGGSLGEALQADVYKAQEQQAVQKQEKQEEKKNDDDVIVIFGKSIQKGAKITPIENINTSFKQVVVKGHLVDMTEDEKKHMPEDRIRRVLGSKTSAVYIQKFFTRKTSSEAEKKQAAAAVKAINDAFKASSSMEILVRGMVCEDKNGEPYIDIKDICAQKRELREDRAQRKRVELHLHTTMSEMDGLTKQSEALATAARWGHKALAITDHGVVHAFPDAMRSSAKCGVKLLYGVEGYLQDDCCLLSAKDAMQRKCVSVCVVAAVGMGEMNLREIAAVRHDTGEEFHTYVNTGVPTLSNFEYKYESELIANAPSTEEALLRFCEFANGYTVVTYTPNEYSAMCHKAASYEMIDDLRYIDMKSLIHYMFTSPDPNVTTNHINNAFRALDGIKTEKDEPIIYAAEAARKTKELFCRICESFLENGCTLPLMHGSRSNKASKKGSYYHIILLAKNRKGLKNMYKMVTYSHAESFKYVPLMPRSLFSVRKEGIILGSACERGELFRAMLQGADDERLKSIASWYDYLEIQPIGNNAFMIREGIAKDEDELRGFNKHILAVADGLGKMCVATGDVHFLEPEDAVYRSVIMHAQHFKDAEQQAPLYFKTTDEMLEEFSYLGEDRAQEVVIDNPNAIADMCDELEAYLNEHKTYAPVFDGANDELTEMSLKRVHQIYGDELPEIVQKRLDFELNSIIGNNYATLYLMAQRLVKKSNSDGYLVGSRGSVGSSFVAFLAGITEVNPLCAHYVCPKCRHSDFNHGNYWCGADMPDKNCPVCGEKYIKYGFDIPFETFLGFKGDKVPDIDLNFSGEYQPNAHAYTKVMFGDDHSFRAGVISTLKDKTVFGYVKSYAAEKGMELTRAEEHRLVMGCAGVKRTTGQHPGGMVVVPPGYEAEDFMPLQYPANKKDGNGLITHFDFHAMDDKLVKLDILGHVDPTALRMMQDMTGLNPRDIPLDDPETRALFSTSEPLKIDLSELDCDLGTIGIPEYGTQFVRGILKNTRPTTIEELVRLAGLSHGTNVWQGNAEDLVMSGKAGLGDVIGTRDDIMIFLISKGSDPLLAFKTMESVRKGKGLTPEMEENMKKLPLPDWYIPSCKLIKYMFPRAHAAAYLTMAFRVAYYKMHYPHVFYAVYFTTRADDFDIVECSGGAQKVIANKKRMDKEVKGAGKSTTTASGESVAKLTNLSSILEVVYEMNLRGIEFLPVNINESHATKFLVKDGKILPPFNAISGLGAGIAEKIVEMRTKHGKPFTSIDTFKTVTGAGTAVIEKLEQLGCFNGMAISSQTTFF